MGWWRIGDGVYLFLNIKNIFLKVFFILFSFCFKLIIFIFVNIKNNFLKIKNII